MISGRPEVKVSAAAVCSIGARTCKDAMTGTEKQITEWAENHARANPGHVITCQVQTHRTWRAVEPTPEQLAAALAEAGG